VIEIKLDGLSGTATTVTAKDFSEYGFSIYIDESRNAAFSVTIHNYSKGAVLQWLKSIVSALECEERRP
jgi:hypothetical protein